MRLSDFAPRLNGIVTAPVMPGPPSLRGIGSLGDVVSDQITSYFNSFMGNLSFGMEHGGAATPDMVAETLTQASKDSCAAYNSMIGSAGTCDPNSYVSLIAGYVAQYTAAYNTALASMPVAPTGYWASTENLSVPATGYVAPNALDTVAPSSSASSVTGAMTINNVSGRSSSQFLVGDGYQVLITGAPNQPVLVSGTKNGASLGTTQVGTTDGSGHAVITGVMGAGDVGNWVETWAVGGQVVGHTSFSVVNAPATGLTPPTTKPPVTSDQVLNNQTQGGSQATANGTSGSNTSQSTSGIMDWLTADISTSIPIPMWMALAGGLVAVLVVSKK